MTEQRKDFERTNKINLEKMSSKMSEGFTGNGYPQNQEKISQSFGQIEFDENENKNLIARNGDLKSGLF